MCFLVREMDEEKKWALKNQSMSGRRGRKEKKQLHFSETQ